MLHFIIAIAIHVQQLEWFVHARQSAQNSTAQCSHFPRRTTACILTCSTSANTLKSYLPAHKYIHSRFLYHNPPLLPWSFSQHPSYTLAKIMLQIGWTVRRRYSSILAHFEQVGIRAVVMHSTFIARINYNHCTDGFIKFQIFFHKNDSLFLLETVEH